MNLAPLIGFILGAGLMLLGITLGSPVKIFIDPVSCLIVPGATLCLLLSTHGSGVVKNAFSTSARSFFGPTPADLDPADTREILAVANSGVSYTSMTGLAGVLIGLIRMLSNMDDPTSIGPAMALSLLCGFYSVILVMFIFEPMRRHFSERVA
jgi:flagellar motor component MotA